ncbi:cytidylyltransferase domain-containing protein [Synechococcus sp. NOUM97013]|uniref:acylneuraminate cytidylyltransferase family protein n=1 Tax=Synechococcus sp. NOUM97013 TaxID=1442555 RepID=UPI0016492F61|nr:acylneuraminate cytidylyltransferase family protein [Synechococcus sp. NOUM97013]QNI72336.1 N-acylneuraminate cytidylyltransferase [Synechococcus sp. NOUM97013]
MSLLALIPARGGSKGIPRKNIRSFSGKPLLQWSIDVALASPSVDRVVVSTDDLEIAEIALAGGAEVPFLRPSELATDTSPGIAPVLHVLEQLPDVTDVLLMQPTSPLRLIDDVEGIIALSQKIVSDAVVSVTTTSKHPAWMYTLTLDHTLQPLMDIPGVSCRQQLPSSYILNGSLYFGSRALLERQGSFLSPRTLGYVMPPERSVDIDTLLDWQWGEFLMEQQG